MPKWSEAPVVTEDRSTSARPKWADAPAVEPEPGFWGGVYSTTLGPLVDIGKTVYRAAESMDPSSPHFGDTSAAEDFVSIPGSIAESHARQFREGSRDVEHALTEPGLHSISDLIGALGHGVAAAVPIVGPAAMESAENITTPGRRAYGLGQATGLVGVVATPEAARVVRSAGKPIANTSRTIAAGSLNPPGAISATKMGKVPEGEALIYDVRTGEPLAKPEPLEGSVGTKTVAATRRDVARTLEALSGKKLPVSESVLRQRALDAGEALRGKAELELADYASRLAAQGNSKLSEAVAAKAAQLKSMSGAKEVMREGGLSKTLEEAAKLLRETGGEEGTRTAGVFSGYAGTADLLRSASLTYTELYPSLSPKWTAFRALYKPILRAVGRAGESFGELLDSSIPFEGTPGMVPPGLGPKPPLPSLSHTYPVLRGLDAEAQAAAVQLVKGGTFRNIEEAAGFVARLNPEQLTSVTKQLGVEPAASAPKPDLMAAMRNVGREPGTAAAAEAPTVAKPAPAAASTAARGLSPENVRANEIAREAAEIQKRQLLGTALPDDATRLSTLKAEAAELHAARNAASLAARGDTAAAPAAAPRSPGLEGIRAVVDRASLGNDIIQQANAAAAQFGLPPGSMVHNVSVAGRPLKWFATGEEAAGALRSLAGEHGLRHVGEGRYATPDGIEVSLGWTRALMPAKPTAAVESSAPKPVGRPRLTEGALSAAGRKSREYRARQTAAAPKPPEKRFEMTEADKAELARQEAEAAAALERHPSGSQTGPLLPNKPVTPPRAPADPVSRSLLRLRERYSTRQEMLEDELRRLDDLDPAAPYEPTAEGRDAGFGKWTVENRPMKNWEMQKHLQDVLDYYAGRTEADTWRPGGPKR